MTISEPSTLITDYLLGALSGVLAGRLIAGERAPDTADPAGPGWAKRLWAAALAATAVGSLAGGTYHGFAPGLAPSTAAVLWKATTLAMGVASFCLLAAVVASAFAGAVRRALLTAAAIKLAAYSWWMLGHDAFVYVMGEYGSTLLIVLALVAAHRVRGGPGHRAHLIGGILISAVAAVIQQSGLRLHTHFNHNDLMHVVQMGAVWLLYQGGRRLQDANGRE